MPDGTNMNYDKQAKTITVSRRTGITLSISLLITLAFALVSGAVWVEDLANRVQQNSIAIESVNQDYQQLQSDNISAKVQFSQIQEQLKSIDANILDIKARLN